MRVKFLPKCLDDTEPATGFPIAIRKQHATTYATSRRVPSCPKLAVFFSFFTSLKRLEIPRTQWNK